MLILPSIIKAKLNLKFLMVTLLLGSSLSFHITNAKESSVNSSVQSKNPVLKLMIKDYGTYGQVFNIAEECILKEIMERLELAKENGTVNASDPWPCADGHVASAPRHDKCRHHTR